MILASVSTTLNAIDKASSANPSSNLWLQQAHHNKVIGGIFIELIFHPIATRDTFQL